jgi:hypothetical protein
VPVLVAGAVFIRDGIESDLQLVGIVLGLSLLSQLLARWAGIY